MKKTLVQETHPACGLSSSLLRFEGQIYSVNIQHNFPKNTYTFPNLYFDKPQNAGYYMLTTQLNFFVNINDKFTPQYNIASLSQSSQAEMVLEFYLVSCWCDCCPQLYEATSGTAFILSWLLFRFLRLKVSAF